MGSFHQVRKGRLIIAAACALSAPWTSSGGPIDGLEPPTYYRATISTAGMYQEYLPKTLEAERKPIGSREAVVEVRKRSGLTWEQLGELFEVSRRSIHFWASGKAPTAQNERRLMRVLDVIRTVSRGGARATRAALLEDTDGVTAFGLLVGQRFDEATMLLGPGNSTPRPVLMGLSAEAKASRRPLPPEMLVDAKQDRLHHDLGRARGARTVRNVKRDGS